MPWPCPGILVDHRLIRRATNWRCCRKKWPRLPAACSRCGAPAAPRASLRERCCRVSDKRRAPFRSRRRGMPLWPDGIVGSLAHDSEVAVAAMAAQHEFPSVGVDVEPAEPLAPDLLNIVATARERERIARRSMSRPPAVLRQGGDLQGGLSARQDVPGSPRCRGEPFERRRHGRGSKWRTVSFQLLCRGPHCCAGVHSGAARRAV